MIDPLLKKTILLNNEEQIQKYVKNQLPNNPESLQKIYQNLASFSLTLNDIIQGKTKIPTKSIHAVETHQKEPPKLMNKHNQFSVKRQKSLSTLQRRKSQDYFEKNKQQNITRRHQSLIRSLKQRGLRGSSEQIPLGLQIIQKQQSKITKPLQLNSRTIINENNPTSISKCIKKFNINKEFYSNSIKDAHIDAEKYYDRDMKKFLDKRTQSLGKINSKVQFDDKTKELNFKRFDHVESLIFAKTRISDGLVSQKSILSKEAENMSPQKRQRYKQTQEYSSKKSIEAQELINNCSSALSQQLLIKSRRKKNFQSAEKYSKLHEQIGAISDEMNQIKERLQFDGMELSNNSEQLRQLAREYSKNKMLDKYTMNYLRVVMGNHSNETLLANRKDLIRNELKLRKITMKP